MDYVSISDDSRDSIIDSNQYLDKFDYSPVEGALKTLPAPSTSRKAENLELNALRLLSEKYKKNKCGETNSPPKSASSLVSEIEWLSAEDRTIKQKKNENNIKRMEKAKERAEKTKIAAQEKQLKQAVFQANKNIKPVECLKFLQVQIDNDIVNESYGTDILAALQAMGVTYRVQSQVFSGCITWTRTLQSQLVNDEGELSLNSEKQDTNETLLIINKNDFVKHVDNETLSGYIQSLKAVLENKKLILAIYGLQSYKKQKNHPHDIPTVSPRQIEDALTEMQLLCNTAYRSVESTSEMGLLVEQCTKSIAEIPFKQQKSEKFQKVDWYMGCDNRDCVRVDKDGNGLNRLWKQILTTFPLARLETAEAIMNKYPTVSSLMEAYDKCASPNEAELLLQDIQIRRAAGPLSSSRRIGPELSKKVYKFFSTTDPELLFDQ